MLDVRPSISELTIYPKDEDARLFVCVSGTSESGKSEFSSRLFERGIANKIKYLRVAKELGYEKYGYNDPFRFLEEGDSQERLDNATLIWGRIVELTEDRGRISVIETIKHPQLLRALGAYSLGEVMTGLVVFFDAEFEARVARESKKQGISEAIIRDTTREKDSIKRELGMDIIRAHADITVLNNGTHSEYVSWIDEFGDQVSDWFPASGRQRGVIEYS